MLARTHQDTQRFAVAVRHFAVALAQCTQCVSCVGRGLEVGVGGLGLEFRCGAVPV